MIKSLSGLTTGILTASLFFGQLSGAWAESILAQRANGAVEVFVEGSGPLVLMIPSLGRGAGDFEELGHAVAAAGYRVARMQPRGVGRSTGATSGLSMRDLVDDAASAIEAAGGGPAVIVGHAFGQRLARLTAATHPELVRGVIMLAAGGKVPPVPGAAAALFSVFNNSLTDAAHLNAVRVAFLRRAMIQRCGVAAGIRRRLIWKRRPTGRCRKTVGGTAILASGIWSSRDYRIK